jgi:uncharacterized protein YprB with RNaseH-like and TPR domain
MSTLDRLRQLVRGSGGTASHPAATPSSVQPPALAAPARELIYEPVDEYGQPMPTRPEVPALPGASVIDTPAGRCIVIDHTFAAESSHGRLCVQDTTVTSSDVIAFCERDLASLMGGAWGEGLGRVDTAREGAGTARSMHAADGADEPAAAPGMTGSQSDAPVVFLDLETTGLSGGAGTVAFLVGVGFFRDGAFHTRQFFLTGFAAERAMLHAVTSLLAEAGCLVTYNGKTFDVPVMETRWLFHRVPPPWTELTHLDMLHVSRRLWRARGDLDEAGCRLVTLEHDLFGVIRHGDVGGWEIPGRYFEYIRHGDASLLEPVLHHNRLDLLSLACLTARALRLVRDGAPAAHDPRECLALGRELARLRDEPRAEACFNAAAESPFASASVRADALYALARRFRRARRYHEAADAWRRLMECNSPRAGLSSEAREALAVHYEHRDRDLDAAHEWATDAYRTEADARRREAFAHRLARLRRKIAVHAKGGPETAFNLSLSLED